MGRLTLILSDLYLPADAVRESFPTALALPALDWLLRFSREPGSITDWRPWLARELDAAALADWPVAHVCSLAAGVDPAGTWVATPVALEARLDHVRLRDRGILRLPLDQVIELMREFQASFGPETLAAGKDDALLLKGGPAADPHTTDPARLLDSDVGAALPQGDRASELRRLTAEIEMWLPGTRTNAARERAGQPTITSLWLWGGGKRVAGDAPSPGGASVFELFGSDLFACSLATLLGRDLVRLAPERFEKAGLGPDAFVVLAPMSGPTNQSLRALEANWFEPVRDALSAGALDSFRLVANDRVFEIAPRAGWKFWRRRRTWLESLA
jgi:hypothetical protein